jgi:MerR family transcriptional regulator, repressor of the yfmOP operon
MKISEFAEITGLSKDTIRYYEKIGLLHPEFKSKCRQYSKQDTEIIETILKLKQTGFSLQEIKMLFDWSQNTDQNEKLTYEEIQNLLQIKEIFQKKYVQMVQTEHHIKQIKKVLRKADYKLELLLEKNKDESFTPG